MRVLRSAGWLGGWLLVCAAPAASAAEWYTGAEAPDARRDWIVAVDTSVSVTTQGSVFGKATVTGAVTEGLSETGARIRVEGLGGRYSYQDRLGARVEGKQAEGSALAGYEWVWRDATLAGFVGLNVRDNQLSRPDPGNPAVGTAVGAKAVLELYARPTERTMVHAYGSYSTTFNAYFARLRTGYALPGIGAYLGPEVAALGDDHFGQYRIGAHLSGLRLGAVELGLAGGYLNDRVLKNGFYSTVDARATF